MKNTIYICLVLIFTAGCGQYGEQSNMSSSSPSPSVSSLQVKLAWTSNLGEQQGFNIEQSSDGKTFSQILTVQDGTNSSVVTLPSQGKVYYYRIRGFNQAGDSPYSTIVSVSL